MNKKVKFSLIALAMAGAIATLAACGEKDPGKIGRASCRERV